MQTEKQVTLVGAGCGKENLTAEGLAALRAAEYILGARRLIEQLPEGCTENREAAVQDIRLLAHIRETGCRNICVVFSGDTGFYSGAKKLLPLLEKEGIPAKVLPGISSLQQLAARLGRPWQEWALYSAHGVCCDPVAAVRTASWTGKSAFFLTGGESSPDVLCAQLEQAGLGSLDVVVGENLGCPDEAVWTGTAAEFSGKTFAPLSVLLVGPAGTFPHRTPGFPDEAFLRGKTPMTKQEVRAAILAKLAITLEDVCWDIGAGTGSVSIELALQSKAVYGIEYEPEACSLIRENRERFGAWNLRLVEGKAPDALQGLPQPDAVFVGGSGGNLRGILQAVHDANPKARVCVSAIALETLDCAAKTLTALDYEVEIVQIAVSRARKAGELHLLMAQNPVFLITGYHKETENR